MSADLEVPFLSRSSLDDTEDAESLQHEALTELELETSFPWGCRFMRRDVRGELVVDEARKCRFLATVLGTATVKPMLLLGIGGRPAPAQYP